ncbi:MAG: glycosyltransferase family 2 protein, partial [Pseudomonadota bacterium]
MPQTTTLIATARNEGPFLLEWVAYHRAIGFDHIVVLSDTSEDGSEALLDKLASTRAITHIPADQQTTAPDQSFPARAYTHAQSLPQVQEADWVIADLKRDHPIG